MKQDFTKISHAIKYWMLGRNYLLAVKAYEFGKRYHVGKRKDGVTPEYQHQISQANFARTLEPHLLYPEATLATIFLHDVVEDCDVTLGTIRDLFGEQVATAVELMTNAHPNGDKKETASYYTAMSVNPIASIAKGCDRMHNHQSMSGVFSAEKQVRYIAETKEHILPMLKAARIQYPEQEGAYENIKHILTSQIEFVTYANSGLTTP